MTGEITRHSFKKHEWLYIQSKRELVKMLKKYQNEVGLNKWRVSDVERFLQLYNHLYGKKNHAWHHVRCIVTIISDGELL